jgi:hypothetical protein
MRASRFLQTSPGRSHKMPGMKILPAILLLCLPLAVHADWGKFDFDYDQ